MIEITDEKYKEIVKVLPQIKSRKDLLEHYDLAEVLNFISYFKPLKIESKPGPKLKKQLAIKEKTKLCL